MKVSKLSKQSQQNIQKIQTLKFHFDIKLTEKKTKHAWYTAKEHIHSQSNQNKNSKQT